MWPLPWDPPPLDRTDSIPPSVSSSSSAARLSSRHMDDDEESVGLELELDALNPSSLTRKELSFGLGLGGRNDLDDDDDDGQSRRYSRPGKWKPCCARPWVPADHAPPLLTIPPYDILPTLILPLPPPLLLGFWVCVCQQGNAAPAGGTKCGEQRKRVCR